MDLADVKVITLPGTKQFEVLLDTMPHHAWIATAEGEVLWYNRQWFDFTQTDLEKMRELGCAHFYDANEPEVFESWHKAIAKRELWEKVVCIKGAKCSRWFMVRIVPIKNSEGVLTYWIGTNTDVHEQTLAQRQLKETLDNMSDSFFTLDERWRITEVNKTLLERASLKKEDILGRDFRDVFLSSPDAKKSKFWTEYHRVMRDRVPVSFEEYYEPLDMWTSVRAYPTSEGGMCVFSPDITERKRAELQLRAAKEEAERANMLKSAFLANMSHEIRTPLGAMLGFAYLLRDPRLPLEERNNYLDILSRNGEQLSALINDILDLSKVEAGHLTLEYLPAEPEAVAMDVVTLMRISARAKGISLDFIREATTPEQMTTDPLRVHQVLLNLVNNAVKFTSKGSITVRSSSFTSEKGRRMIAYEVEDTGIGMTEDQGARVFEMFTQADGSMTRRYGGTGLGLALSRKLANSLGGDVILKSSEKGVGSRFLFTLEDRPEKRSRDIGGLKTLSSSPSDASICGMRVLAVDDSPDNQMLIDRSLTKAGAIVTAASNGVDGCKKALENEYDVVFMDIQMPLMDGYSATQYLREHGFNKPIIALSAHALSEMRDRAFKAGCTDHMSKPVDPKSLVAAVARYANPQQTLH